MQFSVPDLQQQKPTEFMPLAAVAHAHNRAVTTTWQPGAHATTSIAQYYLSSQTKKTPNDGEEGRALTNTLAATSGSQ